MIWRCETDVCGLLWFQYTFQSTRPEASLTLSSSVFYQHETELLSLFGNATRKNKKTTTTFLSIFSYIIFPYHPLPVLLFHPLWVRVCIWEGSCPCVCVWSTERGTWLPDKRDTQALTASSISMSDWWTGLCREVTLHVRVCVCGQT